MMDEERAKDKAIIEAASEGPWTNRGDGGIVYPRADMYGGYDLVVSFREDEAVAEDADAAFIAAARTRWPAALDEVDQLRAKIAAAIEVARRYAADCGCMDHAKAASDAPPCEVASEVLAVLLETP